MHRHHLSEDAAPVLDAEVEVGGRLRVHVLEGGPLRVADHHFVKAVLAWQCFLSACVSRADTVGQKDVREWFGTVGSTLPGAPILLGE